MRIPAVLFFEFVAVVAASYSQNLITNPGFESDSTGWSSLYTRVSATGLRTIVTTPVNGGAKATHINYWGTQDWAQQTQADFAVRAGQLYEFSAWVRTDSLPAGSSAGISVVLSDSARQAINWSYATVACTLSRGFYSHYLSRFIIPSGAASIRPRILGYGPCDLYADDASLVLTDSLPSRLTRPFVLQNSRVRAAIDPLSFSFTLTSLTTSQARTAAGVAIFQVTSADTFPDSVIFHSTYLPGNWPIDIAFGVNGPALSIALRADSARALTQDMNFPGPMPSLSGEYLLIPDGTGIICPALNAPAYMKKYTWLDLYQWQADMGFTGATDLTKGYMITTDDPWFSRFYYDAPGSTVPASAHVALLPAKHLFAKNRTVLYTMIDTGGYIGMCAWYRSHAEQLGYVRTWAQKTQAVPATDRLKGAVDFWILGKGFWYSNASAFRDLIDYGMDRAIFSGNFSNTVIDTLNSLGFLTSKYDCYCDAYPPGHSGLLSDGYSTDAIIKEDGTCMNGWLAYIDNHTDSVQAQEVCAASHAKYALPRIATERATQHLNCRFIDVELAMGLQECWSPTHPVNRYTDARARLKLFDTLRTSFGLMLGGEQARDFVFPFVDYGEGTMSFSPVADAGYDWMTPEAPDSNYGHFNINPANHVPLHGLVYHDVHIPTWYTGDGQSKVPAYWDDKDLFNILYATMPLFMPPDTGYWKANFEHFLTSYNLVSAVTRNAGFAKMTGHRALSTDWRVQQTTFDNGWTVTVNFDSMNSYALGNRTLSPRGFYATDGAQEVSRLLVGGQKVAVARLSDRLFVNGYGSQQAAFGIKSSGAVLLKSNPTFIHLAFIGSQSYVDIDTLQLPWPVANMHVYTKNHSQEIGYTAQPNGFVRITRIAGVDMYRIEGTILRVLPAAAGKFPKPLSVRISGSGRGLMLRGTCTELEDVSVTIFNVTGKTVASMHVRADGTGAFSMKTGRMFAAGIYTVRVAAGKKLKNSTAVRAIVAD